MKRILLKLIIFAWYSAYVGGAFASNDINFSVSYDITNQTELWGMNIRLEQGGMCGRMSSDIKISGQGEQINFYTAESDIFCEPDDSIWAIKFNFGVTVVPVFHQLDQCNFYVYKDAKEIMLHIKQVEVINKYGDKSYYPKFFVSGDTSGCGTPG